MNDRTNAHRTTTAADMVTNGLRKNDPSVDDASIIAVFAAAPRYTVAELIENSAALAVAQTGDLYARADVVRSLYAATDADLEILNANQDKLVELLLPTGAARVGLLSNDPDDQRFWIDFFLHFRDVVRPAS